MLIDRNGVSTRILDLARKRLKELPPFTDWLPLRLAITALIRDVKFSRTCTERVAACVELYTLILKCWVLSNGYCLGSTKHMATLVMCSNTRFSEDLRLAYLDAVQDRSGRFIGIAEEQLLVIGGHFNSGDKLYLSNKSRNSLNGRT